jgi:hypothetical protein
MAYPYGAQETIVSATPYGGVHKYRVPNPIQGKK